MIRIHDWLKIDEMKNRVTGNKQCLDQLQIYKELAAGTQTPKSNWRRSGELCRPWIGETCGDILLCNLALD
jgi:hypothetical protein